MLWAKVRSMEGGSSLNQGFINVFTNLPLHRAQISLLQDTICYLPTLHLCPLIAGAHSRNIPLLIQTAKGSLGILLMNRLSFLGRARVLAGGLWPSIVSLRELLPCQRRSSRVPHDLRLGRLCCNTLKFVFFENKIKMNYL